MMETTQGSQHINVVNGNAAGASVSDSESVATGGASGSAPVAYSANKQIQVAHG